MGCCGKKRESLLRESMQADNIKESESIEENIQDEKIKKIFEYTGDSDLSVRGITGKLYYFPAKGAAIEVDFKDSHSLMAENDLRLVKG